MTARGRPHPDDHAPTRRTFLAATLGAAASIARPLAREPQRSFTATAGSTSVQPPGGQPPIPTARFIGTVPLARPDAVPLGRLLGSGLDARLSTDLSRLERGSMVTPTEQFYVRTARPAEAVARTEWTLSLPGPAGLPSALPIASLSPHARPMGACLLECSGNGDPDNFGLMSVAEWQGVPVLELLEQFTRLPRSHWGTHVRISGVDAAVSRSRSSVPGASWVFALDDLNRAFIATGMNQQPLPADHGAPARLVVPGWYGCVCLKWIHAIEFVDDRVPATTQMLEFAARTHQPPGVTRASDFSPARIDHAAMPVRIERWVDDSGSFYRVVGIVWGGQTPTNRLAIRFGPGQAFVSVEDCPLPPSTDTWSLWTHLWRPPAPGRYEIALGIADPALRSRRLQAGFYRRFVEITEV